MSLVTSAFWQLKMLWEDSTVGSNRGEWGHRSALTNVSYSFTFFSCLAPIWPDSPVSTLCSSLYNPNILGTQRVCVCVYADEILLFVYICRKSELMLGPSWEVREQLWGFFTASDWKTPNWLMGLLFIVSSNDMTRLSDPTEGCLMAKKLTYILESNIFINCWIVIYIVDSVVWFCMTFSVLIRNDWLMSDLPLSPADLSDPQGCPDMCLGWERSRCFGSWWCDGSFRCFPSSNPCWYSWSWRHFQCCCHLHVVQWWDIKLENCPTMRYFFCLTETQLDWWTK